MISCKKERSYINSTTFQMFKSIKILAYWGERHHYLNNSIYTKFAFKDQMRINPIISAGGRMILKVRPLSLTINVNVSLCISIT